MNNKAVLRRLRMLEKAFVIQEESEKAREIRELLRQFERFRKVYSQEEIDRIGREAVREMFPL